MFAARNRIKILRFSGGPSSVTTWKTFHPI